MKRFLLHETGRLSHSVLLFTVFLLLPALSVRADKPAKLATAAPVITAAHARSPALERESFKVADPELTVDLVAAEPDVISPVAICWDADGAMYVAEMRDYPVGPRSGTIRRLTDADGDGRYESATLFADDLNFPNGVLCVGDGLLVTAAPDILLLRDRDGDGVSDERRVVFTGFGEGNQQLRANGLCWGLDNWIYGANGRSDGLVHKPGEPAEQGISIRTRDFRFTRDFSRFEAIMGQSQFGQTRDDSGRRFLSWNTIPIRQALFDSADVDRNPYLATIAVHDLADPRDVAEVFPISPRPQTFNRESTNHYNALAGLTLYRGDKLGATYYGNAFAGESLSGLVHRLSLTPAGPTFVTQRGERGQEFLAAADPWFHPVFTCTGPDGSLYVADFYRRWVEHPQFVASDWRDKVDWREGVGHGRIWRVRRRDDVSVAQRRLSKATTAELVSRLDDKNGWQRDTAQRLLVERADRKSIPLLIERAQSNAPQTVLPALWILESLEALDEGLLLKALAHSSAEVRRQALLLVAPRWEKSGKLREAAFRLANPHEDSSVRFQLARSLGGLPGIEKLPALVSLCRTDNEPWIERAMSAGAADVAGPLFAKLVAERSSWLSAPTVAQVETLWQLAERWTAAKTADADRACLSLVCDTRLPELAAGRLAILAGAAHNWRGAANDSDSPARDPRLVELLDRVLQGALDGKSREDLRALAVGVVGDLGSAEQVGRLLPITGAGEGGPSTEAAVAAICRRGNAESIRALFEAWATYTPARRRLLSATALESPTASREFVDALARQVIRAAEIDPAVRDAFGKVREAAVAKQATALFAAAAPAPRDEVLTKYKPALELTASREHGAVLFKAHCATCHTMLGLGRQVGPDLSGIAARPKETILGDLLDPSRQVAPDYLSYSLVTRDGRALTGILVSDTSDSVTLRRGEGADDVVPRADIEELQAAGKSLMPEGFEQRLSVQDVADVLSFLSLPERRLLEQP